MKAVTSILLALLAIAIHAKAQNFEGKWDECVGIDSMKTFTCKRGYTAYVIDNRGFFVHRDSLGCGEINYPRKGRWIISGKDLEIIDAPLITEDCSAGLLSRKFRIKWVNEDLILFG